MSKDGIYQKFIVRRTDGKSRPGQKHAGCRYFVIDLSHDEFAKPALKAYAEACESKYPELARDLREYVEHGTIDIGERKAGG